jgi:Uma2 family endonuclease
MVRSEMPIRLTPEEYLLQERDSLERHQYYRGEVVGIEGGSAIHSAITANVIAELGNRLKGGVYRVFESHLRIGVPTASFFSYADVGVVFGKPEFDPRDVRGETLLNPTLLVEVLSPSTEAWDRGIKLQSYIQIESLHEYVLVSSQAASVETFFRQSDGIWLYTPTTPRATAVKLRSVNIEIGFADIFAGVTFPPPVVDVPVER